jgi:peptidase E
VTPVTSLSVPTKKKFSLQFLKEKRKRFCFLPDLGVSLETEPVRQRTVLLLGLAELDLGDERLLRRLL